MKDLFSAQSELYAKYRPVYPPKLYDYVLNFVESRDTAWDCATGNGQVARELASYFRTVVATDISANQLKHATRNEKIKYSLAPAERTPFHDNSFDLITVAQAYHWLDTAAFCREAKRVARPGAIVAVWGYHLTRVSPEIDPLLREWNLEILRPFWEPERRHVVSHYETLAFDFEKIETKDIQIGVEWTCKELVGHMNTWSALQKMITAQGDSAFRDASEKIKRAWGEIERRRCVFPIFMKIGSVKK